MEKFRVGLMKLINQHSLENGSGTPDFVLANYITECLKSFDNAVLERHRWRDMVAQTQIPLALEEIGELPAHARR